MNFHIISIFPDIFNSYFSESIIKRARENKLINIKTYNLRNWTSDKHKTVDDSPYGGGAGMIMKIEPLYKAIKEIKEKIGNSATKTILFSAKGKTWTQQKANEYTKINNLILICGRYEGVDERIIDYIDEEISIGDYILTGGEIPAMAIVDSVTRLLPDVLGNKESIADESYSKPGILEYPQYTRPEVFIDDKGQKHIVPDVLLSGNHKNIKKWQKKNKTNK